MAPRLPSSLILGAVLLGLGFGAGAISLWVQKWQTGEQAKAAAHEMTGGDATRGKAVFSRVRCGACHAVRGLDGADGQTAPALDKVAGRAFLAGDLPNHPAQMTAWVQHPQAIRPGSGMPEMGLSDRDARDVAAFLYTLR